MPFTQPRAFGGFSGARYGSFAGKSVGVIAYSTDAVVYIAVRAISGLWTANDVDSQDRTNLRSFLPAGRVPIGYVNNDRSQPVYIDSVTWFKWAEEVTRILGIREGAPTLQEIVNSVIAALETAQEQASQVAAIRAQATTNAAALDAQRQVSINNALTGADQIPPVQLSADEYLV